MTEPERRPTSSLRSSQQGQSLRASHDAARGHEDGSGRAGHRPSVLFERAHGVASAPGGEPAWFSDLNLDQFVAAAVQGREEYDLTPYFHVMCRDPSTVRHRQAVLGDLEDHDLSAAIATFAERMRRLRGLLKTTGKIDHRHYRAGWFLDASELYCAAVGGLGEALDRGELRSRGLCDLRDHLADYRRSPGFERLAGDIATLRRELGGLRYSLTVRGTRVTVARYEGEPDYSAEVESTFAKFAQGAVKDYKVRFAELDMNHVQARVLDQVARLFPDAFSALDAFVIEHRHFIDETIERFDKEVQFFLAYLDYIAPLRTAGVAFCLPEVSEDRSVTEADDAVDLVLAKQRITSGTTVVANDFTLEGPECILVVTGPNQGGKTTFARLFGQLHYLAGLGLYVPARRAALALTDGIFTHFERRETLDTLRGKLEDEVVRVHDILSVASPRSVVIMNETFTSTTLDDALFLGRRIVERMTDLGVLGVYVTFVDELASLNDATVSMVAMVEPERPTERTFKIARRPADGLAYAGALADKYGLTYRALVERMAS